MEQLEKTIKETFMDNHIPKFGELINFNKLRLYAFEFPVFTNNDGTKFADIVLEQDDVLYSKLNQMMVLEFKKDKVDHQSAVAQVLRYADVIEKQLYRKKKVMPFVVAPLYSEHEIKLSKHHGVGLIQYDYKTGWMQIID